MQGSGEYPIMAILAFMALLAIFCLPLYCLYASRPRYLGGLPIMGNCPGWPWILAFVAILTVPNVWTDGATIFNLTK